MSKKVLVIHDSQTYRFPLFESFREKKIRLEKHQQHALLTEEVHYYFIGKYQRERLIEFFKKHQNVDKIITSENFGLSKGIVEYEKNLFDSLLAENRKNLEFIKNGYLRYLLLALVDNDMSKIQYLSSYSLDCRELLKEHSAFSLVKVYYVSGKKEIATSHLLPKEVRDGFHFYTNEEAQEEIIKQANKRISEANKRILELSRQIEDEEKIIEEFSF